MVVIRCLLPFFDFMMVYRSTTRVTDFASGVVTSIVSAGLGTVTDVVLVVSGCLGLFSDCLEGVLGRFDRHGHVTFSNENDFYVRAPSIIAMGVLKPNPCYIWIGFLRLLSQCSERVVQLSVVEA